MASRGDDTATSEGTGSSGSTSGRSSTGSSKVSSPTTSAAGASASGTSTTGASSSTAKAQAAALPSQECLAEVRAASGIQEAVASSAKHWRSHVDAQLKLDAGTYTVAQTKAQWKKSKAAGPADEAAYAKATAADTAKGSCAADAKKAPKDAAVAACTQRLDALRLVGRRGGVVHQQWAEHLEMMAHKEHSDGATYLQRWRGMVTDAQPTLRSYDEAAAALEKAPACA